MLVIVFNFLLSTFTLNMGRDPKTPIFQFAPTMVQVLVLLYHNKSFLFRIFVQNFRFFPEKQTKTKFGEKSKIFAIFDSKRNAKNANLSAKEKFAKNAKFSRNNLTFSLEPELIYNVQYRKKCTDLSLR